MEINGVKILCGDSLKLLDTLEENSVDSVVTDPPYHLVSIVNRFGKTDINADNVCEKRAKAGADGYGRLSKGFMGKEWDGGDIAFQVDFWNKVFRVLKPGGHIISFGGTRTYHRMVCAIEDAGFEIRDQIAWVYGTGFPKSHDVSKGIDKAAKIDRKIVGIRKHPTLKDTSKLSEQANASHGSNEWSREWELTEPATDEAKQWQGWGTALKPAFEPICLARKPLSEKTVAANVLRWGTGALNIDATRIVTEDKLGGGMVSKGRPKAPEGWDRPWMHDPEITEAKKADEALKVEKAESLGRWPANLAHDESDEVLEHFPTSSITGKRSDKSKANSVDGTKWFVDNHESKEYTDSGSAARFFYSAKANKNDRAGSKHPTVKPISLIRWLVKMVTPPNGIVLDPFAGSGTLGAAAYHEGFKAILMEREEEYQNDIVNRLTSLAPETSEKLKKIVEEFPDLEIKVTSNGIFDLL